jgi:anti-sigma factor RsiW
MGRIAGMVNAHLGDLALGYIEGRLTPGEQQRVGAHLAACAGCRAEVTEMAETANALRAVPAALGILPWARDRVWRAVWERAQPRPFNRPAYPVWQVMCSLTLVLLFFVLTSLWPRATAGGLAVTIDGVAVPRVMAHTPMAFQAAHEAVPPTAMHTRSASTAAPVPIPTPLGSSEVQGWKPTTSGLGPGASDL